MTTASCVPAVLDALYAVLVAAYTDPNTVTLFDGPPPSDFVGDTICVGWSPYDETGGQSTGRYATTAGDRDEDFDVVVYISVYPGDAFKALRDRAEGFADTIATSLRTTPTVGVITGWAGVAATVWHQGAVSNGIGVGLELHIQGTARI